jgi:hypothetical protein
MKGAGRLFFVLGGAGGVRPARGRGPAHDAGLGLFEFPPGCVLGVVVPFARRTEVALAAGAGGVRDGVVDLARDGLGPAAGRAAAGGAGADEVLELPAWDVAVLEVAVITGSLGDRLGGGVQLSQELGELRRPGAEGAVAAGLGRAPGVGSARRHGRWPRRLAQLGCSTIGCVGGGRPPR